MKKFIFIFIIFMFVVSAGAATINFTSIDGEGNGLLFSDWEQVVAVLDGRDTGILDTFLTASSSISDSQLSANVPLIDGSNNWTGVQTFYGTTNWPSVNSFGFEGSTADDYETTFTITDPTADRFIYVGNFNTRIPALSSVDTDGSLIVEGTEILSTVETGGVKYLREDGDGTCSWQTPAIADSQLSANVPLLDADNTFTGNNTFGPFTSLILKNASGNTYYIDASITEQTSNHTLYLGDFAMRVPASTYVDTDGSLILSTSDSTRTKSFAINEATADDDFLIWKPPYAITIVSINGVLLTGTNVIGGIDECDSAGANPVAVDADITFDGGNDADDGTLTNASVDADDWLRWHTTSASSPGYLTVTIEYTVD